jgi:hypothetical protein
MHNHIFVMDPIGIHHKILRERFSDERPKQNAIDFVLGIVLKNPSQAETCRHFVNGSQKTARWAFPYRHVLANPSQNYWLRMAGLLCTDLTKFAMDFSLDVYSGIHHQNVD